MTRNKPRNIMKTAKLSILILSLLSLQASASMRHYSADLTSSKWQLSKETPIQCTLTHEIPNYGTAQFTSEASRSLNMMFELDMLRLPDSYSLAEIRSVAPSWRPGVNDRTLTTEKLHKQFNLGVEKKIAWTMLNELEKGMSPTFYYTDWYSPVDKIAVGLSTAKFQRAYSKFLNCVGSLLNYSFDDIAFTTLNYQNNSSELTKASKKRLAMIQEYLKHDTDIELVVIDGYSDSIGGRWHNKQVSERRANSIKSYFTAEGVEDSRIITNGRGERRHIAANSSPIGRDKNRRVIIQMAKP